MLGIRVAGEEKGVKKVIWWQEGILLPVNPAEWFSEGAHGSLL